MASWLVRSGRAMVAGSVLCAAALGGRPIPVRAEPEGVLAQHMALLDRNARAFGEKNREALAKDLTADYVRIGPLGDRKSRGQEMDELERLFAKGTRLRETSQPTRLVVQGGDATTPTVATTLVETRRSADVVGSDGKVHAMMWETVDTEERISTADGWKCRKRLELKSLTLRDGAPFLRDASPATATAREELRRAYSDLAAALDAGDAEHVRKLISPSLEAHGVDGKVLAAEAWLAEVERRRKEAWKSDTSYQITGLSVDKARATVACQHTLLRQAADKEGVIRTVRETNSVRDTWERAPQGWALVKSEALLGERDLVLPVEAVGWGG